MSINYAQAISMVCPIIPSFSPNIIKFHNKNALFMQHTPEISFQNMYENNCNSVWLLEAFRPMLLTAYVLSQLNNLKYYGIFMTYSKPNRWSVAIAIRNVNIVWNRCCGRLCGITLISICHLLIFRISICTKLLNMMINLWFSTSFIHCGIWEQHDSTIQVMCKIFRMSLQGNNHFCWFMANKLISMGEETSIGVSETHKIPNEQDY